MGCLLNSFTVSPTITRCWSELINELYWKEKENQGERGEEKKITTHREVSIFHGVPFLHNQSIELLTNSNGNG